ncbi:MAG: efflux RND transporter permease subunit [Patescibacteria group bacterium]
MLNQIILWAINHKWTTIIVSALIAVLGIFSLLTMKVDVLPNINKPTVAIFTEGEGLAPEEIERLILTPIESAVAGAPGVERIRGTASFGLAIVQVEFNWGSDIYRNRQIIQERIAQLNLPEGAKPTLGPVSSVMGEIMWVGISSKEANLDGMDLRTLADWTIRPALLRLPGVSDVIVMGGDVREWQININAERLAQYELTVEDIVENVEGALQNRGGGILVENELEYPIRILVAPSEIDELQSLGVGSFNDTPIVLGDVASLIEGPSPVRGAASIDGKEGVVMRIVKQPEAETLEVTKLVDETLESLERSLPEGIELHNDLFRQEWFITASLENVIEALRDGIILVIIILILFLANTRTTLITLTAIPMSILVTAIVFKLLGFSVNVMTLGGIAVAIGELVDDAIVDVENVFTRLREWRKNGKQEPLEKVVFKASSEVRNSIVYATLLVAIVFLPIFFIPGVEGKLLAPLGLAYLTSLIASLFVSLTLTPALCVLLLGSSKKKETHEETRFVRWVKKNITPLIGWSINHSRTLITGIVGGLMIAIVLFMAAGKEGVPPFNEGAVTVGVVMPVGTDLQTSNDFASQVETKIREIPGIVRVSHLTGRAGADPHDSGANTSEIQVTFDHGLEEERTRLFGEIQKVLDEFQGADFSLGQPITHKMEELLSGVRAPIVIKVFGDDLDAMREVAEQVRDELKLQPGVTNAQIPKEVLIPEYRIFPNRERLGSLGLSSGEIADELEAGLLGVSVGQVQLGSAQVPVVVRYDIFSKGNMAAIRNLSFAGDQVTTLNDTSDIQIQGGLNRLSHEGGKRVIIVSANYQGKDIVGAVEEVKQDFESIELPQGITLSFEGTYKSQKENSLLLLMLFGVGLCFIFGILYHAFRSSAIVILIMLNIPTALIGGIIGVWITGGVISLAHLIGFISLAGIVSRNGIMLISHTINLVKKEGLPFTPETMLRSTLDRVVPVLMTSLTALLALIPFLLSSEAPGKEMLYPLAVVIFSGLTVSTIISLFLTPSLFYRFGKKTMLAHTTSIESSN